MEKDFILYNVFHPLKGLHQTQIIFLLNEIIYMSVEVGKYK